MAFISSCEDKNLYDPDEEFPNPIEEINVPDDFDWKTMNTINLKVIVDDQFEGKYAYQVDIYDGNPVLESNAKKIATGYARKSSPLNAKVTVPTSIESLWVKQTAPTGLASFVSVSMEKESVTVNFGPGITARAASRAFTRSDEWGLVLPEIDHDDRTLFPVSAPTDATVVVGTEDASDSKNYIINGQTTGVKDGVDISLFVTEDAILNSLDKFAGRKVYILPGKKLTLNFALSAINGWQISIGEGAQLITTNIELNVNSTIYNLGTISCNSVHTKNTSVIYNAGIFTGKDIKIDSESTFYNLNKVEATSKWDGIGGSSRFYNAEDAEINVDGPFAVSSGNIFINDGTANFGKYSSVGSSKNQNNGIINVAGLTEVDAGKAVWYNNGTWITETMTTTGVGNDFINGCKLIVNDKLTMISTVFSNLTDGYIKAKDFSMTNSHISMDSEAFFDVTGLATLINNRKSDKRGDVYEGMYGNGTGEKALFRIAEAVTESTNSTQAMYYSGNLQVACDNHFPEVNPINKYNPKQWLIEGGAQWASYDNTVTIPSSECNAGTGGDPNPPVDPTPEPDVEPFTYSYLFEDMWPFYGDYDMNDVVLRIKDITYDIDKNNQVSKFSFEASLRAVGAQKRIAGALMLDNIQASEVKSVSYSSNRPTSFNVSASGIENNQTNAVVPLFDEVHRFMMGRDGAWYINTYPSYPDDNVDNPPVITVTVEFNNPVDKNDLIVDYLNFFIITDIDIKTVQNNPRREIHVVDYQPTAMAETSLFGNNNDGYDVKGRYYISKQNLPWGILISDEFEWPTEHTKIQDAYKEFEGWINSNKATNKEWYKNPTPGLVFTLN